LTSNPVEKAALPVEVVLTTLHAGGKFDGKILCGSRVACMASVVSVVNALSAAA